MTHLYGVTARPVGASPGCLGLNVKLQPCTHHRTCRSPTRTRVRCNPTSTNEGRPGRPKDAKSTIADLDALLGIEEEQKDVESTSPKQPAPDVTISAEALETLRRTEGEAVVSALERLIDNAQSVKGGAGGAAGSDALRREVARVASEMLPDGAVSPEMVEAMKKEILGPTTFWVTEVTTLEGALAGGVELRGNLRTEPRDALRLLQEGLEARYAGQFVAYLAPDALAEEPESANGRPRVVLQVLPAAAGAPPQSAGWQVFAALVLFALTLGSTASLSALAALPKLPAETLAWLANPDPDFTGDIPGLTDAYDPVPFLSVAFTMFLSLAGVNAAHEAGHRLAALRRRVKLGPALFVPNGSLGSFGSVTAPASAFENRAAMWDVAAAGPIAGLLTGGALFTYGLMASADPSTDPASLIPVPAFLFQGSIVLGSLCEAVLGPAATGKTLVHPALIAGWCGLFVQAFNLLPVGSLDGGRLAQAAFGRTCLNWTSVLSYMGLALGVIGGQLSLPFGLFVLIAQREPERYVRDSVSAVNGGRETATTVLVLIAILILVPFSPDAPELVDSMQLGMQSAAVQGAADPGKLSI